MKRLRRTLSEPGFSTVVFLLGAVALGWPVVSIAAGRGVIAFFVYLFVVWSLLVLLMLAVARAADGDDSR